MSAKDEPRHTLKLFSRKPLPAPSQHEKPRTLNRYELKTPMYPNKPHNLIDGHVSETVQFAGEIEGVSPDLDITNRTDVLRIIDKGKKQGVIPVHLEAHERLAILSLSVFNIKISAHVNHISSLSPYEFCCNLELVGSPHSSQQNEHSGAN
ncbi:cerebral cavernous malformations protein 2 homolog isoform X2 [Elysia marginata]|uniref:Cerebral cavernous malformations protein 2 homolog isoform X2 n=1 Tax=Elysia marginata TaxID=1093978 RepID=A0AAV4GWW3_9GAST|nr:cerebral cavernous malformations protein 2 homolog isoform X2 [Elysia marginata]